MKNHNIVVIGGVNIDIGARPNGPLIERDSNPGHITTAMGGVARNIAHNLCLLGESPVLLSCIGDDLYGRQIREGCRTLNMDVSRLKVLADQATSTYLYIADHTGDMRLAVNDMTICESITPEYLSENQDVLDQAEVIVIDANLSPSTIDWLTTHEKAPILADPVSVAKAEHLKPYLSRIHTLKPNRMEAELLSGVPIYDEASLREAARGLIAQGLQEVYISLGEEGVLAAKGQDMAHVPIIPAAVKNATGAGDAFMAAVCVGFLERKDLRTTALMGAAASSIAVEGEETINPALSLEAIQARIHTLYHRDVGEFGVS